MGLVTREPALPLLSVRAALVFSLPYAVSQPLLLILSAASSLFLHRLLKCACPAAAGFPTDIPLSAAFSVPTPSASCGLLFVIREPYRKAVTGAFQVRPVPCSASASFLGGGSWGPRRRC